MFTIRSRCAVIAILAAAVSPVFGKNRPASWLNPANGTWDIGSNWSVSPSYPNNDSHNSYLVTIAASGSPYTVTLDSSVNISSLTLNSASATLDQTAGTLNVPTFTLSAGTYKLEGGATLQGATVSGPGSFIINPGLSSAVLDGVTLASNAAVADLPTASAGDVRVYNNLTLSNSTLSLGADDIVFWGTQSLAGTGTVSFTGSPSSPAGGIYASANGALTLASGIHIQTATSSGLVSANSSGSVLNYGTLSSNVSGLQLTVHGPVTNYGTIEVNNGGLLTLSSADNRSTIHAGAGSSLLLTDNWLSSGAINLDSGSATEISGNITTASLRTVHRSASASLVLTGSLNNAGDTFVIDALTGAWPFAASATQSWIPSISGGTVTAIDPVAGVTIPNQHAYFPLQNLTIDTNLTSTGSLEIENDVTLNAGRQISLSNSTVNLVSGSRFLGSGQVVFDASPDNLIWTGAAATIGPSITIRTGTSSGTIQGPNDSDPSPGTLLLQGLVSAQTTNQTLNIIGRWSNTGTLEAINSSWMFLTGTSDGLGSVHSAAGGTIVLSGLALNNTGKTISLNDSTGNLYLQSGYGTAHDTTTVTGGILATSGSAAFHVSITGRESSGTADALLDSVTLAGNFILDPGSAAVVRNGLTLQNGSVTLATYPGLTTPLTFDGTQTLSGTGSLSITGTGAANLAPTTGTLTIGPGVSIYATTASNTVGSSDPATSIANQGTVSIAGYPNTLTLLGTWSNSGTVQATASGGLIATGGSWVNNPSGVITASTTSYVRIDNLANAGTVSANGGSITIGGSWSNTGTLQTSNNGTIILGGIFDSFGTLRNQGGEIVLATTYDNTGKTLALNDSTGPLSLGQTGGTPATILGGTLSTSGSARFTSMSSAIWNTLTANLDSVTLDGQMTVHGLFNVTNGLTLTPNAALSISDGVLAFNGTQTLAGPGVITFDGSLPSGPYSQLTSRNGTLTIGPSVLIQTGANSGLIQNQDSPASSVLNYGTIQALNGKALTLQASTFTNYGTIRASGGGSLSITGLDNHATVDFDGNSAGILTLDGNWSNAPGATLRASNANVSLRGNFTTPSLLAVQRSGTSGWTEVLGSIDNTGYTLPLDSVNGAWPFLPHPSGVAATTTGAVVGGTLTANNAAGLTATATYPATYAGAFDNLTLDADLTLNANLELRHNITLADNHALRTGSLAASRLTLNNAHLVGTGQFLFDTPYGSIVTQPGSSDNLIGPGITIRTTPNYSGLAEVGNLTAPTIPLVNQGLISSETPGAYLNVAGTIDNQGTLQVANGGTLRVYGYITSLGTLHNLGGTFELSASYDMRGGTLALDDSTGNLNLFHSSSAGGSTAGTSALLRNGTLATPPSTAFHVVDYYRDGSSPPTGYSALLYTTTLAGNLVVDNHGVLWLNQNFSLRNGNISLVNNDTSPQSANTQLDVYSCPVISGTGQILLTGSGTLGPSASTIAVNGSTTFSPGISVRALSTSGQITSSGAITNQGLISAEAPGKTLLIQAPTFTNSGTLQAVNGATLSLAGNWSSTGPIVVDHSTLSLGGTFFTSSLASLQTNAATVILTGSAYNIGNTISLNSTTGDLQLAAGASIGGGTLSSSDGAALDVTGNATLNSVTLNGDVSVSPGVTLTLNGSAPSTAPGRILLHNSTLSVTPPATLRGPALILFNGDPAGAPDLVRSSTGALTIGPAVTIATGTNSGQVGTGDPLTNQGTLLANLPASTLTVLSPTNQGLIRATNGATASLSNFTNASGATISADSAARLLFSSTTGSSFSNAGTISTGAANLVVTGGTWSNSGTLSAANASNLTLNGSWSNTGSMSAASGSLLSLFGTWSNTGSISLADSTLFLESALPASLGSVSALRSSINVDTAINAAQISPFLTGGNSVLLRASLDNTSSTLDLTSTPLSVQNGGIYGGTLTSSGGPALQILASAVITLSGVTVDVPVTVAATSNLNAGYTTFNAPVSIGNGSRVVFSGDWANTSNLAMSGGNLTLPATGSNTGTISLYNVALSFASFSNLGTIARTGGSATFTGTLDNTGSTFDPNNTAIGAVLLGAGAHITGGTLSSASPVSVSANGQLPVTFDALTLSADVSVTGQLTPVALSSLQISNGLTFTANHQLTIGPNGNLRLGAESVTGPGSVLLNGGNMSLTGSSSATNFVTFGPDITVRATAPKSLINFRSVTLLNQGTIVADGAGASLSITGLANLTNQGTLRATNGAALSFTSLTNLDTSTQTLTAGSYEVFNNSTLTLPNMSGSNVPATVSTNAASILLSGPNSSFPALNSLSTNAGSLTVTNGRTFTTPSNFTTAPKFTNSGTLTLGPDSALKVLGTLTNSGTISLTSPTSALLIDYSTASPIDAFRNDLLTGHLITPLPNTAIAYFEASLLNLTTYAGLPVDSTTLLTKLTLPGDANLNGRIDADDYALLDRSFARQTPDAHWTNGDFNYDGQITSADYLALDTSLGLQSDGQLSASLLSQREAQFGPQYVAELVAAVPEPSLLGMVGLGLAMCRRTRYRRRRS